MSGDDLQETALERGAASVLWRSTLSQIPSVFGRLAYLASLRDQNTGTYFHFGLEQAFGCAESDRILRQSHENTFADWLCFTLEQQKSDLDHHLSTLGEDRRTVIETWLRLVPYRAMIPAIARDVERRLYLDDLETILELLRAEYGVACPDPDA